MFKKSSTIQHATNERLFRQCIIMLSRRETNSSSREGQHDASVAELMAETEDIVQCCSVMNTGQPEIEPAMLLRISHDSLSS